MSVIENANLFRWLSTIKYIKYTKWKVSKSALVKCEMQTTEFLSYCLLLYLKYSISIDSFILCMGFLQNTILQSTSTLTPMGQQGGWARGWVGVMLEQMMMGEWDNSGGIFFGFYGALSGIIEVRCMYICYSGELLMGFNEFSTRKHIQYLYKGKIQIINMNRYRTNEMKWKKIWNHRNLYP